MVQCGLTSATPLRPVPTEVSLKIKTRIPYATTSQRPNAPIRAKTFKAYTTLALQEYTTNPNRRAQHASKACDATID